MSQSSITDLTLSDEWSKWYVEHLEIMLTVNGIDSAERFTTDSQGWPFSLAMYSIRSPEIFEDPYYLKITIHVICFQEGKWPLNYQKMKCCS